MLVRRKLRARHPRVVLIEHALGLGAIHLQGSADPRVRGGAPAQFGGQLERTDERKRLVGERAPRQVAAEDDQVDVLALDLSEDGGERRRVSVDVGQRGDAQRV